MLNEQQLALTYFDPHFDNFLVREGQLVGILDFERTGVAMALQVELFVHNVSASIDFYQRVLGFQPGGQKADEYTPMSNGPVRIALNRISSLPADHPVQVAAGERVGRGVEFVLEVEDLPAIYAHVLAQQWPVSSELQRQPWGLQDFRLVDPDGYYWRITERRR